MAQRSLALSKYSKDAVRLLATLIRCARKEKGMTEQELARLSGASKRQILAAVSVRFLRLQR